MGPFLTIFASFIALFALCYEVLGVKFESMNEKMIELDKLNEDKRTLSA